MLLSDIFGPGEHAVTSNHYGHYNSITLIPHLLYIRPYLSETCALCRVSVKILSTDLRTLLYILHFIGCYCIVPTQLIQWDGKSEFATIAKTLSPKTGVCIPATGNDNFPKRRKPIRSWYCNPEKNPHYGRPSIGTPHRGINQPVFSFSIQ